MKTSYDEIRRMAFRALDAAQAAAGIDEDSAYAVAWLEAAGLPGLAMLADAIDDSTPDSRALGLTSTDSGAEIIRIDANERSCAFYAATIIDLLIARAASGEAGGSTVELANTRHPLFLLPTAVRFCPPDGRIGLNWRQGGTDVEFSVTKARVLRSDDGEWSDSAVIGTVSLTCTRSGNAGKTAPACVLGDRLSTALRDGLDVDDKAYSRIAAHAAKILVPETQASRVSGAGAGLTDND